jgi:AraC family transcriptional regulator, regulatory protein of adaptative response / DNA-3-methyladenine glycosylase II
MDSEQCYRVLKSRDARFDGYFFVGVTSTGIYCRPSCPATTPRRENTRFFPTAAGAQRAGFRACKRCMPDATPGSPEWDLRADLVGRAMRLIADGIVDREGVPGLARRLGYSERHVNRTLLEQVGAGPLALARAQRSHTARLLLQRTTLPVTEIAFAAGFASVRQFNDTMRAIFDATPTELRRRGGRQGEDSPGSITLRLPYRSPIDLDSLFRFLAARAVPGVEEGQTDRYRRSLDLAHGAGIVDLFAGDGFVRCALWLDDPRDLASAVQRCRRLLDLDADPVAIAAHLGNDRLLRPLVERSPGLRVPGHVDGAELAARAIVGQQVSLAAARTVGAGIVARYGKPLTVASGSITHLWPRPDALADADTTELPMPRARGRALTSVAGRLASGALALDSGVDRRQAQQLLLEVPGIGHWTARYIAMRLGDPDAFLPTDLGIRRALGSLGGPLDARAAEALASRWRPWRSYATQHLMHVPPA